MGRINNLDEDPMVEVMRRLTALERAAPVGFTTVSRGALRIISEEGLIVEGSASISGVLNGDGDLLWDGNITFTGPFQIDGVTYQNGDYTVNGGWTFVGDGDISGDVNMTGVFDLTGNANLSGTVTITGPLAVKGASTLEGNLNIIGSGVITAGLLKMGPNTGNGGAGITATSGDLYLITTGAGKVVAASLDVLLNLSAGEINVIDAAYVRGDLRTYANVYMKDLPTKSGVTANLYSDPDTGQLSIG